MRNWDINQEVAFEGHFASSFYDMCTLLQSVCYLFEILLDSLLKYGKTGYYLSNLTTLSKACFRSKYTTITKSMYDLSKLHK